MANQVYKLKKAQTTVLFFLIFLCFNATGQGVIKNGTQTIVKEDTYLISDNDFSVETGAALLIEGFVTINGTLENTAGYGGITVSSNSTQSGSLIFSAGSPSATVKRFSTDGQWHLISSPVAGADANQLYFDNDPKVWLKEYNEPSNDWSYITDLNTPLNLGKGFAYWVSSAREDVIITYEGNLNSGDLTLNNSSVPPINYTDSDHGYNLIGSPFSSAIDWDDDSWVYTDIEETVWVWQDGGSGDGSGNYLYRNKNEMGNLTDGIIPFGQGFFVRATAATGSITIPSAARTHSSQEFYKKGQNSGLDFQYLVLDVMDETNQDQVWIAFKDVATEDFDNGWDVSKFFSADNIPQMYLHELIGKLSIDVLPPLDSEPRSIDMGFIPGVEGDQLIVASMINDFDDVEIILEDKKTGNLQDIKVNSVYQFNSESEDDPSRFILHFNPVITSEEDDLEESTKSIKIFSSNKYVFIKDENFDNDFQNVNIRLIDMTGKVYQEIETIESPLISVRVDADNAYLIVRYQTADKVVTEKVFIK